MSDPKLNDIQRRRISGEFEFRMRDHGLQCEWIDGGYSVYLVTLPGNTGVMSVDPFKRRQAWFGLSPAPMSAAQSVFPEVPVKGRAWVRRLAGIVAAAIEEYVK